MQVSSRSSAPNGTTIPDEHPGGDYDQLPYISMPVAYSQPTLLAALAALHDLRSPAADAARVLEIGCASGGNIIPLAARFPRSRFLGIDLSATHIDIGRRRIAELGLTNIELRQDDITNVAFSGTRFDYVICHGVFSWVPKAAQDSILRICGEALADDGIAAISYNVLPGWHTRAVVRDMCLRHAGTSGTPRQRVAKIRVLLEQLAKTARQDDPYGLILRSEAARLARRPASYILGEFLTEHNAPCHVRDFLARAEAHGLAYLSEADLLSSTPELFMPAAAERIRAMAGSDPATVQEYTDFFSGRTFRRSLLVKAEHARRQHPGPEHLGALSCASQLRLDVGASDGQAAVFKDHRNRNVEVRDPLVRAAFTRLGERYPATATAAELADMSRAGARTHRERAERLISEALFKLVAAGRASVSSLPLRIGEAGDQRPRAWAIARAEAAAGQPWVTSLHHTAVLLNPVLKVLLGLMTGDNDRSQLTARLIEAARAGQIGVDELQPARDTPGEAGLAGAAAESVARALTYCAINAMLEPST